MASYGYISHHGILGQKWGERNGPPYPLSGGQYSPEEKRKKYRKSKRHNSYINKKYFDRTVSANKDTLATLSHDPNRLKETDMFFAAYDELDKHQYNALLNRKAPRPQYDKNGNQIGTGMYLKYKINSNVKKDMKVASEDSAAKAFMDLYSKDRDFYNFVSKRMKSLYPENKYVFKGYKEAFKEIDKLQNPDYKPSEESVKKMYRLFNYVLPNDGGGNEKIAKDVLKQRTKFFNEMKERGYGAILDTNDSLYGGFKATAPIIVFDMDNVISDEAKQTKMSDKAFSKLVLAGRKTLKI